MAILPSAPPRCVHPFSYLQLSPSEAGLPKDIRFTSFTLGCPCGQTVLRVHGYWFNEHKDLIGPLAIECGKCGMIREFIDTDKDGYNGEIGESCTERGTGPRSVWTCAECNMPHGRLIASFGYQFEPDAKDAIRWQDLFDAFIFTHVCLDTQKIVEITMFDCA